MRSIKVVVVVVVLGLLGALPYLFDPVRGVEEYSPSGQRVLLLGVEGVSWPLLEPMMEAGNLPNLAAVRDRTTQRFLSGSIRGPEEEAIQPSKAWGVVSTGYSPEEHGLSQLSYRLPGDPTEYPITSVQRRRPTLWEVASSHGCEVAVAGWWPSWPAEWVNGTQVSDRFFADRFDCGPYASAGWPTVGVPPTSWTGAGVPHLTYPESLADTLAAELEGADQHPLIERLQALQAQESEPLVSDLGMLISALRHDLLVVRSMELQLARGEEVDLAAVLLQSLDVALPLFFRFRDPRPFQARQVPEPIRRGLDAGRVQRLGPVIPWTTQFLDQQIGRLMQAMGDDATTMLVSTHTWRARTQFVARDYCFNRLLEELGLLFRDEQGEIDYERTVVWDDDLQPQNPRRQLTMNFRADFPQGFVEGVTPDEQSAAWAPVTLQKLLKVTLDQPWPHPDPSQGMIRHIYLLLSTVSPSRYFLIWISNQLPGGGALTLPDGRRVWIEDIFPPLHLSGELVNAATLAVVAPEGGFSRGPEHQPPIGDENLGWRSVAPTVLAVLGLPRPVPAAPGGMLGRPQRLQDWMLPDRTAQEAALATVPDRDYLSFVGRNLKSDTAVSRRLREVRATLTELGLLVGVDGQEEPDPAEAPGETGEPRPDEG